jgi:hypothetical protein
LFFLNQLYEDAGYLTNARAIATPPGAWFPSISTTNKAKERPMSPTKRDAKHQAKALTRRRLNATERHERQPRQSQRDIEALQQALHDLGLPDDLGTEIAGRLHAPQKRLGTIVGLMFPPLFGCITTAELTRTRGWDTHLPSRMLGALPQRAWLKRLRKRGQALLVSLWRPRESMSAATRRRWPWSWGLDDAVFRPYGAPLEWVGTWWRGQHQRVGSGMDGGLLLVVIGDGKLVGPVDLAVRRPNPKGLGRRCRMTLAWAQGMRDATRAAWRRRGLELPAPLVVAESGVRDSQLMAHVANTHQGTFRVQGKNASPVSLEDGHKVQGADGVHDDHDWPWRQRLNTPDSRYARLRAKRPTSGQGTVILVDKPGAGAVCPVVCRLAAPGDALAAALVTSSLDGTSVPHLETSLRHRRVPSAQ